MAASKNFKCQYLPYSLADLNKIHTKVFALIRSLLLNVLLLTIAFSFKEVTFLESTIINKIVLVVGIWIKSVWPRMTLKA